MKVSIVILALLILASCSNRTYTSSGSIVPEKNSVTFSESSGSTFSDAIVVYGVRSSKDAIAAEYQYISDRHGRRGQDWFLIGQTIVAQQSKIVDVVEYQLNAPGDRRVLFFDAGNFLK